MTDPRRPPECFDVLPEVADALAAGRAVVALESTIVSHGLPRPENLRVAREVETTVRAHGGVPATIAIVDGRVRIGLDDDSLDAIALRDDVEKVSVRDLGSIVALRGFGATTVAATSHLAVLAGIRLFATGGLGGVHRGARDTWDESADLTTLGNTRIAVVCAGVKSILDVGATLERLETLNVGLLGYGSGRFPGFYLSDSGHPVHWRADTPAEVAAVIRARDELQLGEGLVIANPLPTDEQVDPDVHDHVLAEGMALAAARGVRGKDVTPFLLDHFHRSTHGASLEANVRIVLRNAALATQIAVALCASTVRSDESSRANDSGRANDAFRDAALAGGGPR